MRFKIDSKSVSFWALLAMLWGLGGCFGEGGLVIGSAGGDDDESSEEQNLEEVDNEVAEVLGCRSDSTVEVEVELDEAISDALYKAEALPGGGFFLAGQNTLHLYEDESLTEITNATGTADQYYKYLKLESGTELVAKGYQNAAILRKAASASTYTEVFTIVKGSRYAEVQDLIVVGGAVYALAREKVDASTIEHRIYKSTDDGANWSFEDTISPDDHDMYRDILSHPLGLVTVGSYQAWNANDATMEVRRWDGSSADVELTYKDGSDHTIHFGSVLNDENEIISQVLIPDGSGNYGLTIQRISSDLQTRTEEFRINDTLTSNAYAYMSRGLAQDDQGNLFFVYEDGDDATYEVFKQSVYGSFDGGETWSEVAQLPSVSAKTHKFWNGNSRILVDEEDQSVYVVRDLATSDYSSIKTSAWKVSCEND